MTSLAFVMGVLPLALSSGAGSEMRRAMGVAVLGGMLGVTAFGIFLTPVFYVLLRRLTGDRPLKLHGDVPHVAALAPQPGSVAGGPAPALLGEVLLSDPQSAGGPTRP
jgi:multidrug efflux pump